MDISKKSDTELKALAYDCLAIIEANQNNLRLINEELARRQEKSTKNKSAEVLKK